MNIHFTDINLFNSLREQTILQIEIGSELYNLKNENSDTDYLLIYVEPLYNRNSFMWEHHQLQYKDIKNNIDYNFTSLQTFIRNALTGDSTINFEVLFSDALMNSKLNWLSDYQRYFINYKIIHSFCGLAKRDLRYWQKDTNNGKKHTIETHKKLSHFVRGVIFAKMLINGYFKLDLDEHRTFTEFDYADLELLDRIKHGSLDYSFKGLVDIVEKQMHILRVENNVNLEKKNIVLYMNSNIMKELDEKVESFINEFDMKMKVEKLDYGKLYYESLEEGVRYENNKK